MKTFRKTNEFDLNEYRGFIEVLRAIEFLLMNGDE